jgi:flagellin
MIGAIQNRLTTIVSLHQNSVANLEQSKSLLIDADFAKETSELARAQVLQNSASAMISQANRLANEIIEVVNSATGRG